MSEHGWREACGDVVAQSITSLFDAYGVMVTRIAEPDEPSNPIAATIGFTSPQASGTLTLTMSAAVVASAGASGANLGAVTDWAGELANQALGRIKNRLLSYGIELRVANPVVVVGTELRVHPAGQAAFSYWFSTPTGRLNVHLSAKVDSSFVWVRADDTPAMAEGEFMML